MTVLSEVYGALDPAPYRWTYPLDELTPAGVHLPEEQAGLLDPDAADNADVVVVMALPDPLADVDGYRAMRELPKLVTRDDYGFRSPVIVPMTGRVDWGLDGVGDLAAFHQPDWHRFPTVPVRIVIPDRADEEEEQAWPVRVWNAWPMDPADAWQMHNAAEQLYCRGWYDQARTFAAWKNNRLEACELRALVDDGAGGQMHFPHSPEQPCPIGDAAAIRVADELFADGVVGWWRPKKLTMPSLGYDAGWIWSKLIASSLANTNACLDAVPHWERNELARSEERYSPWVLS